MKTVLVKLLFYVFAGVGLIFQLKDIMKDYFDYKTSSRVELLRESVNYYPALVFCVRFSDILNRSNYNKYGIHPKRHKDWNLIQHELSVLTVKDIFDLTPDPEDVIEKCEYRNDSYQTLEHSKDECYKLLKVVKYFTRREICYQFMTTNVKDSGNCNEILLSLYDSRKVYAVRLNDECRGSHTISMISFYAGREERDNSFWILPTESRKFAMNKLRLSDFDKNLTEHSSFYISHVHYQSEYMPPPYDTMCTTNLGKWKPFCEITCNAKVYERHGRISPIAVALDPLDLKVISHKDLKNMTLVTDIAIKRKKCIKECIYEWCIDDFTVTEIEEAPTKLARVSLAAACSLSPTHKLIFYPMNSLNELLIYITSSFGVWFGFCFVSLNPTSLLLQFKRKMKTRRMPMFQLCIPTPENQQEMVRSRNLIRYSAAANFTHSKQIKH